MSTRNFGEMLEDRWNQGKFVCVGLDSQFDKIPECVRRSSCGLADAVVAFNNAIVESTKEWACAYKPNIAFYESHGSEGLMALRGTIASIHANAPGIPVILDAKRADIGNTNNGYTEMAFDFLQADAITVHPFLGAEALKPFLDRADKGIFVLCRTSNPGAGEFQDLPVTTGMGGRLTQPLFEIVAERVAKHWNKNNNCALVVGATYPEELHRVRGIDDNIPILIPGIGAQGGDLEKTVAAGKNSRGQGMIINSSRGIIFASNGADFAEAAGHETEKLHNHIRASLELIGFLTE